MSQDKSIVHEIDISGLFENFEKHLSIENNSRILFSGKFGIGKTYFLKKFFEKNTKYSTYYIYPTNYQLSNNDDILEYLKYDILLELINTGENFSKERWEDRSFINFIRKNVDMNTMLAATTENFVGNIPPFVDPFAMRKLGKPLKKLLDLDKKFQDFKNSTDLASVTKFIESNNSEPDVISQIIKNKIQSKGTSVLIIDDLDRIDPEHIFRILNILSSQFEVETEASTNKFGFSKIILVADYNNLVSIFQHKYGSETDYSGYFDKFFSMEIFSFDNSSIITNQIDQIITKFIIEDEVNLREGIGSDGFIRILIKEILMKATALGGKEKVNLRQLLKPTNYPLSAFKKGSYKVGPFINRDSAVPKLINVSISALVSIFGGRSTDLIRVLENIRKGVNSVEETDNERINHLYCTYLLSALKPYDRSVENDTVSWESYQITIKNGEIVKITNSAGAPKSTSLLYDLLIEYVKQNEYIE